MIDDNDLIELINKSEWLLEGLDKDFWKLIKLSNPEIWENPEDHNNEYSWVIAVMGNKCVFYNDEVNYFDIASYEQWGEIRRCLQYNKSLHGLISEIINSRFKVI